MAILGEGRPPGNSLRGEVGFSANHFRQANFSGDCLIH